MKLLYSRLGFKVIKDFATYPNFEESRRKFNYESGKSRALKKQTIGLQYHLTITRRVKIIHDNQIDFNENINVFKDLDEVHHQMIGSHMNILMLRSRKSRENQRTTHKQ